ncbi:MAG: VIT domain-containing protein [Pseudomonadota bacterium]
MAWARRFATMIGLALALLPLAAQAQSNPTLDEYERGIKDADDEPSRHLRIDELVVTAHVVGRTADVTLDLLVSSDSDDAYQANLELALPADAVVTGYALSVGDALIPGQLLERPKARSIYDDEVRAGIDPGLAEISAGNRFSTRIYPIDREHPRRFRLSFVAPFDPATGIVLPLSREAAIGKVGLTVTVDGYDAAPVVRFAGEAVTLTRDGRGWRGGAGLGKRSLRDGLAIAAGTSGTMAVARHSNGESFFVIDDGAAGAPARVRPGRLRVYWDRSLSHGRDRRDLEIEALTRLADATGATGIDLVSFASDRPRIAALRDSGELRRALEQMVYRGGTSLEGLDGLALPRASQCVLVFDGQVTIDRGAEFIPDCPLSLLTASTGADGARLGTIAQRNSARLVRVGEGKAGEAAGALARSGTSVTSVRDQGGRRVPFRALAAGPGRWLLVGQMPGSGGVRVQLSDGSERAYAAGAAVRADAPGALWAAQQVVALNDDPARHKTMVEFARRYHVAGPAMSLLVLERPDQYLRAELTPPPGFGDEWMAEYREARQDHDKEAAEARTERLDFVVEQWKERTEWWRKRFAVRPQPKSADRAAFLVPPPAMAAPAPVDAPAPSSGRVASRANDMVGGSGDESDIMVTGSRVRDAPLVEANRPGTNTAIALDLADLIADRPYITALAAAAPAARLKVLGEQERTYGSVPSFYLDVAEWFRLKGDSATAALLLLSALELPLSDDETRQIVAFRLERDASHDRAVEIAEQLATANDRFRPQPARDLALALAARGRSRGTAGRADLERAFGLLTDAALNPASGDFDGFEVIALMEANTLIPAIEAAGGSWTLDRRLTGLLDTDVRIVIEWTADDADIDLWVDEPNGERVYYGDQQSSAGGQISNDMTDGYGPEEYAIRRARPGPYSVRINGYDADRLNPNGPGHVLIRLIRNFGRRSESQTMVDADLSFQEGRNRDDEDETKPVAVLRVGK